MDLYHIILLWMGDECADGTMMMMMMMMMGSKRTGHEEEGPFQIRFSRCSVSCTKNSSRSGHPSVEA